MGSAAVAWMEAPKLQEITSKALWRAGSGEELCGGMGTGHRADNPAPRMLSNIYKQGRGWSTAFWGCGQGVCRGASASPCETLLRLLRQAEVVCGGKPVTDPVPTTGVPVLTIPTHQEGAHGFKSAAASHSPQSSFCWLLCAGLSHTDVPPRPVLVWLDQKDQQRH